MMWDSIRSELRSVVWVTWLASTCLALVGDQAEIDFFEAKVRPLLEGRCLECHSQKNEVFKGGLALDTRAGWERGGESGVDVIVPGKPDESLLIHAVSGVKEGFIMPPKGPELNRIEIDTLRHWIQMGAPDPRNSETVLPPRKTPQGHWAFQRPYKPGLPDVRNTDWPRQSIDYFVLNKLESHGFTPSKQADPRTLLRRLFFDTIGLPPDWKDVEEFSANPSEEAWNMWVERLLASPQYGEKWARHWLDVARYADTKGYVFEEERSYAYAYTYRDYVINAFNDDKPYDQFIKEQLAADFLDLKEDKGPLAAMGYLTLGRRFLNNQHDIIDDRIDVVMRGMMGLTVSCARCHDHKYDPVSIEDYYALYGVFASSEEPGEKPTLGDQNLPDAYPEFLKAKSEAREKLETFVAGEVDRIRREALEKSGAYMQLALHIARGPEDAKNDRDRLAREAQLHPPILQKWISYLDVLKQIKHHPLAWLLEVEGLEESSFENVFGGWVDQQLESSETETDRSRLKHLKDAAPGKTEDLTRLLGEFCVELYGKENEAPLEGRVWKDWFPVENSPFQITESEAIRLFDVKGGQNRRRLQRELDKLDAEHPGAPPKAMVLVDRPKPRTPRVFLRGNPNNPGDPVERRFPEFFNATLDPAPFENGSGRLELANRIANTNNPLTARVMVNRIWMQYFSRPLVDTPSDFGMRAEAPSHPDLLDYLAIQFMENGWSIKDLHRTILKSATYRQESRDKESYLAIDPENRLLWKMNIRRLDMESMRDSILKSSGQLDLTVGGKSVAIHDKPEVRRRSLYAHIDRQNLPGFFRTFDFANPDVSSPGRFTTTVPQQGLYLLNSDFIAVQSRHAASRIEDLAEDQSDALATILFQTAFQREPDPSEKALVDEFLNPHSSKQSDRQRVLPESGSDTQPSMSPLEQLTQALLISNESLFVD